MTLASLRPDIVTPLTCAELITNCHPVRFAHRHNDVATAVTGISHDSRAVLPGDVYVALQGSNFHGIRFAQAAIDAGAAAVLTDRKGSQSLGESRIPVLIADDPRAAMGQVAAAVYGRPADRLTTIGITGTCGKTTTSFFTQQCLMMVDPAAGLVGGVANKSGDHVLAAARHTTPESTDLHALFAVMRDIGTRSVAMEVSSHALALNRVNGFTFDVAVFTNLSPEHLDFHLSMEDYFVAKATLFTAGHATAGVVNVDDEYGRRLASGIAEIPLVTFTASPTRDADWRMSELNADDGGTTFRLDGPGGSVFPRIQLIGRHNVANAVAAYLAAITAGMTSADALRGLAALESVPGRMQWVDAGQPFRAVVDYAHKPEALNAVLSALRDVTAGRIITVVGCGGGRDEHKRRPMGTLASQLSDIVILTNDNPRDENPYGILSAMLDGAKSVDPSSAAELHTISDRASAIEFAVRAAEAADTILVAGKGHETRQLIGETSVDFDDRVVLRNAIEQHAETPLS